MGDEIFSKKYLIIHFRGVNCTVHELYLNRGVKLFGGSLERGDLEVQTGGRRVEAVTKAA